MAAAVDTTTAKPTLPELGYQFVLRGNGAFDWRLRMLSDPTKGFEVSVRNCRVGPRRK